MTIVCEIGESLWIGEDNIICTSISLSVALYSDYPNVCIMSSNYADAQLIGEWTDINEVKLIHEKIDKKKKTTTKGKMINKILISLRNGHD